MPSFRFLHAADIHLDSPLRGLAGHVGATAERVRTATRAAFDELIGEAIEHEVDFVVIAGDLYDGDWRDFHTGLHFVAQMGRLRAAGIPSYVLHGNHDAESQITRRLDLPDNVHVFSTRRPATFELPELGVALHGQSFRQRDIADNLALAYPAPRRGLFNIGVLHTGLGGMGGHANYAPCSLADLVNKGYDYWALGHVHQAQVLHRHPHVAFSGNLQGRHIRETGAKGAYLVTVEDGEVRQHDLLAVDVVRWQRLEVAVGDCTRVGDVGDRMAAALGATVVAAGSERLLACRIELTGRTALHETLLAASEQILADARAAALGLGEDAAWVERVVLSTRPAADERDRRAREDAVGELERILDEAADDADLRRMLDDEVGELLRRLPHELRAPADDDAFDAALAGDRGALVAAVRDLLRARLTAGEG